MSTTSAEEALQRARAIAAKLSGQPIPVLTTTAAATSTSLSEAELARGGSKRKRWGVMPDAVATTTTASLLPTALLLSSSVSPDNNSTNNGNTRAKTEAEEEVQQRRIWVRPSPDDEEKKPLPHYVSYLKRHMPEAEREVHTELGIAIEQEEEQPDDDKHDKKKKKKKDKDNTISTSKNKNTTILSMTLQGRGASSQPPVPGMPEQPLHVLIQGTNKEAVQKAAFKVEQLLLDAVDAPLEAHVAEAYEQDEDAGDSHFYGGTETPLESSTSPHNPFALVSLQSSSSSSSAYRPASVAQLIAGVGGLHNHYGHGGGDNHGGAGGSGGPLVEETMRVPHGVIGFIIGRGGENIASMQARTGCKVQIQKETELQPGQVDRVITLIANSQMAIDQCREQIESMVQERIQRMGGGGGGGNFGSGGSGGGSKDSKVQEALAAGHVHLQIEVPEDDVGLVIGKQGSTIRAIQEQTGASVQVPSSDSPENANADGTRKNVRVVHITHPTQQGAQAAQQQIEDILKSKPGFRHISMNHNNQATPQVSIQVAIPDKDIGLCIGRQGAVIRHMQTSTQTRIQIPSQPAPGESHRIATVTGPTEHACNQVRLMIQQIVLEQSSTTVMMGPPPYGQHQLNQQQQQQRNSYYGGQGGGAIAQDNSQAYSAEWAAYHAAQAAAQQQQQAAQQQRQQQYAAAPAATTQAATVPAATGGEQQQQKDAYLEQFFRYAYYYGEEAARQYYGAWSPPLGTANPYGTNPAGIQPAPAAAEAAANNAAAALAPAAAAAVPQQQAAVAQAAAPSVDASQVRETGRRKVSNLPAWMTKG